jgi:predicted branched-subunit amino acid permease
VVISLTNLTSAGQFAGMNLIAAQGALVEIGLTTLIINIRYFLMSISVSQKVDQKMTMKERMAVAFGITDEIFAVSMQRDHELTTAYMAGLIMTPVLGWTGGTLVGAVATSLMSPILSNAFGIALYGMFIAIIVPPAKEQKNVLFAVLLAIAASVACKYIPVIKNLSSGWTIILITLVVCVIAAWLFPVEEREENS